MSKGERANLKITSDYAYGSQGVGGVGPACNRYLCYLNRPFAPDVIRLSLACVHSTALLPGCFACAWWMLPLLHAVICESKMADVLLAACRVSSHPIQVNAIHTYCVLLHLNPHLQASALCPADLNFDVELLSFK